MQTFTDLYDAYLHWKEAGGYLARGENGTFVVLEKVPEGGSEDWNDFGIFPDESEPPLNREEFTRMYLSD